MDFSMPAQAEAFREEVRQFLADHLTGEMIAATRDGTIHSGALHRAIADRGWLSGAVPAELGGGGMDPVELCVLVEELQLHQAPADALGVAVVVVSMILEHGNEHLHGAVAPRLLSGEALGCLGYSEPESGSDVAAARTRAVRDGDRWVINGSKMWTTLAHVADYVLLLTRTDPEAPKHRGLTFFVVPLDTAGIEIRAVSTMGDERSNATFYDDVVLGDEWRLGGVNDGWTVMKTALKYERGIAGGQFPSPPVIEAAVDWARRARRADGSRPIDDDDVRHKLVRAMIDVEVCRSFAYHTAALASEGAMFGVEGSMTKLFASESYKKHCGWFLDMMGAEGLLTRDDPGAHMEGRIEEHFRHAPVTAIYGGTSEINRNLVAEGWLGLPRSR
ncbi:MAG: acyl-CoA dehydrogenase family protein [Acidimicrobiaceae bacterium]|nr:acyl-CoA dehydrogenase family protein [Acidimicrobiaceae bacterium]